MAAEYRSVHTEMWRADDWFQTLPTDARLLWIYLFTNPSASVSGIYKLPLRTMANETGLDLGRVTELLAEFKDAKKAYYQDGIVWVRKMRDYQLPGKISPQLLAHLNKEIARIPDGYLKREYLIAYGYRIDTHSKSVDTVSIPRATETETETDTDTETDTETGDPEAQVPPSPPLSESVAYAQNIAAKRTAQNSQLEPRIRTPMVNAILDLTGKRALADAGGPVGDRILSAAHAGAVTLHKMGYPDAASLLALRSAWDDDWRGVNGGTIEQFLEFASECKAGKVGKKVSPKAGRNGGSSAPVPTDAAARKAFYAPAGYEDIVES